MKDLSKYQSIPLRFGLGLVFLVFGIMNLMNPGNAAAMGQGFFGVPAETGTMIMTGIAAGEVVVGVLLLAGAFTKIAGGLIAAEMALTFFGISLPALMSGNMEAFMFTFKDLALLGAALSLAFAGSGIMSVDNALKRRGTSVTAL